MYRVIYIMLLMVVATSLSFAQRHTETIEKTLSFASENEQKVVFVENINGTVEISTSQTEDVSLQANLEITGESESIVVKGKDELKVVSKVLKDTILIYVYCPAFNYYRHNKEKRYDYNSQSIDYTFKTHIKLKVPNNILVDASTVNKGDVVAKNVDAIVKAKNVNGNIYLTKVKEVLKANTVNGEIKIECEQAPTSNAQFKTVNGNIYLNYPKSISANLKFKSFNGKFFTDYEVSKYLPVEVSKSSKDGKSTRYKLEGYTTVQIGKGGPVLDMETLNGDVYVGSKKL